MTLPLPTLVVGELRERCIPSVDDVEKHYATFMEPWESRRWAVRYRESLLTRQPIPPAVRRVVYDRDGHRCLRCGSTEHLSLDHIVPWSRCGPDTVGNLQTLCRSCNSKKGAAA